ncbi:MAG: hypothetical protein JXA91_00075 [Candidatus Thermoplasmatota archaeon]|nr:hypothetical protein [Candidatus Thermoplasmatota archaeon]
MDRKTIFLELPAEMIDRIDRENIIGDRSAFISNLLERQLEEIDVSTELQTKMQDGIEHLKHSQQKKVPQIKERLLGEFDINTVEGFENLAKKIIEITDDPIVRMKARRWL